MPQHYTRCFAASSTLIHEGVSDAQRRHTYGVSMGKMNRDRPKDPLALEMGRRIREARDWSRLTVLQVSNAMGGLLSQPRISNYEQGLRQIGPREALLLAQVLHVDAAYLLCVEDQSMTEQERELLKSFRTMPENERNRLLRELQAKALLYKEPGHLTTLQLVAQSKIKKPS
jgi:transcriptional regulator with XRE-family HTH domain